MSTDKKELWLIVSPTECKRVHDLVKPELKNYTKETAVDYILDCDEWEEAEKPILINPQLLEIKELDEVYRINYENDGVWVVGSIWDDMAQIGRYGLSSSHSIKQSVLSKFPLNSIWHGEEREGNIWLTDKI